ncbi:hypothetical protein GGR51DRAFT_520459 [Nemania sp. FL0031]|nr:hypothetical protein GGR51DRAFT_520459 [Nemania sp. FL0031]
MGVIATWMDVIRNWRVVGLTTRKESAEDIRDREIQKRWRDGIEARLEIPEIRFPVVIQDGTGLSSPEQLQTLLQLPTIPETMKTTTTSIGQMDTNFDEKETVICDVNWEQLSILKKGWVSEQDVVWFKGKKRFAVRLLPERKPQVEEEPLWGPEK